LLLLQVGVCPQFDMLWGELTGLEHLVVAGHVKGLPFSEVSTHVLLPLCFC
jgi:ABC-type multidrug transport system ATPase subunit